MSAPATLLAYRLVKSKWAEIAFDGEGAKRYGGRWNSRGHRAVYLAASESLAILEIMVHLDDYRLLEHYTLFRLELARGSVMSLDAQTLPANWREDPAPTETATIGDEWLESNASLALSLPSAIVPRETNYLINPGHAEFETWVRSAQALAFDPDQRLLR